MEKKNFESAKNYLCSVTVKSNDTQQESCRKDIGNYKYVYVICKKGKISFSKITCEHIDMYFYISTFNSSNPSTKNETFNEYKVTDIKKENNEKELTGFWGIAWKTSLNDAK